MAVRLPIAVGRIRAVLVDLSGTIHVGDHAIPGAIEAISKLRQANFNIKFVTNTTKESLSALHSRLIKIGFDIQRHDIFSSLSAAVCHLHSMQDCRPYLMLSEDAKKDFESFDTDKPNTVVIGLSPSDFDYKSMNKAFGLLLNGCPLVAIHKARYFKNTGGNIALGPGAFVHGLEFAADTVAKVVGKPEKSFFISAAETTGFTPEYCVMIGDDVRDDVIGAINAGMMAILVKTGKFRAQDENLLPLNSAWLAKDIGEAANYVIESITAHPT